MKVIIAILPLLGSVAAFSTTSSRNPFGTALSATKKVGIFGGGTVGGGIVEIIQSKSDYLTSLSGNKLEISKICVRDASKKRDFEIPEGCEVTTDYDSILNDESIDIVVEVMGGTTDAKDIIEKALNSGKDVVTANKALIAAHLSDIEAIIEAKKADEGVKTPEFRYEAAVCGGIPVIRSLQSDFPGDQITMLSGIINGCTNYMLTGMDQGGKSYDEVLAEASELGYAEADPTLDVGGFDARSKLKILMRLAFGVNVNEDDISCKGITELTTLDFEYAKMMGGTIKLIGVARAVEDEKVAAFVSPCYVNDNDALSSVNGATNAIEILSNNLQASTYIGQGAGRFPTANSCMNDMVALARGDKVELPFNPLSSDREFVNDYKSVFYIRLKYRDGLGITRQCGEVCEKHGVSIHSILQNPVTKRDDAAFVLITEKVSLQSIKDTAAELEGLDWCQGPAFYIPVLREDWISGN